MKNLLLIIVLLLITATLAAWIRYGGGDPYPDLSTTPRFDASRLEPVLAYAEPIGNVAVSGDGRVFFTVHPEAGSTGNRLLEYVDGASVPYPDARSQRDLFDTVLGVAIDRQNRLWTIDHGNHGMRTARIIAIDLESGKVLRDQPLTPEIAPPGSFLQDLQVSADGSTVVIADASFWRKQPALIVYDVETGAARRILEEDPTVSAENYIIRTPERDMTFLGGLLSLRGGVDGIALGEEWLYYGALSGAGLYRIRLSDLTNENLSRLQMADRVERHATKPLSDGFSIDVEGNVYVTDVEHNAIARADTAGNLETLIRSDGIRWPDALSFGPGGWLYVADSALQEVVLRPRAHIEAEAPYRIFRFRPGVAGTPGQ